MLNKHQQVFILLIGLFYVYSACPLLCAAFEKQFCYDSSQKALSGVTEIHAPCCQSPKTGAASGTEKPSEHSKSCCAKDLELVFFDDRYNAHESRELIEQFLISNLPISVTLPVASSELLFQGFAVPPQAAFFPDYALSHRGPPFISC